MGKRADEGGEEGMKEESKSIPEGAMLCPSAKRFSIDENGILRESFFTNLKVFAGFKDDPETETRLLCNRLNNFWGWYEHEYARVLSKRLREDGGWIDVRKILPKDCEAVLVCAKDSFATSKYVAEATYYQCGNCFMVHGEYPTVTHWMPLPDLPETICCHPVEIDEDMPEDTIVVTDGKYRVEITNVGVPEKE